MKGYKIIKSQDIHQQLEQEFDHLENLNELRDELYLNQKWYKYGRETYRFNQYRYRTMFAQEVLKRLGIEL